MTSNTSMLAAVHAAAASNTTETTDMSDKPTTFASAAALAAAFPDFATALRTEGATAERTRILGIEQAAIPGHDALVTEMKADGTTTPEQAALRILGKEKEARAQQLQGIKDVETATAAVAATATTGAATDRAPPAAEASTPEGWKAQYASSKELQAEFGSEDAYVAFKTGEAAGRIRIKAA